MYFPSSSACTEPNSATPMPQSAIDQQDAFVAAVGRYFDDGDATMDQLIQSLGGTLPTNSPGDAGVPTVGDDDVFTVPGITPVVTSGPGIAGPTSATPGAPGSPSSSSLAVAAGGNSPAALERIRRISARNALMFGGGVQGGGVPLGVPAALRAAKRSAAQAASGACGAPQVLPLVTVFPVPVVVTPTTESVAAPTSTPTSAPAKLVSAPASSSVSRPIPSTGNTCADMVLGLVLSSQADPSQNQYCANHGYQGNHAPPTWVTQQQNAMMLAGTLPKVPFQASPQNTDPVGYPSQYYSLVQQMFAESGVSGLGDASSWFDSPAFWGVVMAIGVAGWYFGTKHR